MKRHYRIIIDTFDNLADSYAFRGGMEEVNRTMLAPYIRAWEGRILDVGCGTGNLIEKYIDPAKREVHTVDFSWNMIRETRQHLSEHVENSLFTVQAVAQELPYPRDSFDAVLSVNTLHNMPGVADIHQALAEMARVLRPRGALLVEFRNSNHPERQRVARYYDTPELPQKIFSVQDVTAMIEGLGFQINRIIGLDGDQVGGGLINAVERIGRKILPNQPWKTPRFAVLAIKGPGFNSILTKTLGDETSLDDE